ncbi:BhlA/UviB family holin-like peptide [Flavobacterium sp. 9R]|uniref:PAS domain-containing protein n=1 Tax=Flavobacterium sp. 9R TaxID=2653143 RepID=UPI00135A1FF1|nr:BhlA/UviB family holin-like peptide [Flavobacterium sp. 9R]
MRSKTNQIISIFILFSIFMAILWHKFSNNLQLENPYYYNLIKDVIFILFVGLLFRYILSKNEKRNSRILEKIKSNNNEIKESNEKYDIVSKATSDTIWDWKIQDDTITWNKGIETIFGYTQEEVGNNSAWWFDKIHPEDSIKMSVKLYSFIEQKSEKWQDQYRFRCADNTYKYVLDRGFLLKDKKGRALRMIGAIQDITKQKKEEENLKLLETVVTQTKDAVVITKSDSNSETFPNIIYVNNAFCAMTGYKSKKVLSKPFNPFNTEELDSHEYEKFIAAIEEKRECQIETLTKKKNKEEYWVRFSMIPIYNSDNELSHWISIQKDVTEERKQEKEKEQLIRELTQNNKDLKQFSYITSHNLRAPLSNLIGLLNLIEDIPINDSELLEIINGFKKSTHLLNETINDLVKIIVIKDKISIQKENVTINEVVEHVFSQLKFQIEQSKPILKLNFDEADTIYTNKAYLESILINLLTNSIKYKSETKKLKISITIKKINNSTILKFKDNGIGIDLKRNSEHIFGLYQRFHDYPDSKGLGLYLVKSQIESLGGTISIESEVNKGTEFTLTF